jgi:hypothetical protein
MCHRLCRERRMILNSVLFKFLPNYILFDCIVYHWEGNIFIALHLSGPSIIIFR